VINSDEVDSTHSERERPAASGRRRCSRRPACTCGNCLVVPASETAESPARRRCDPATPTRRQIHHTASHEKRDIELVRVTLSNRNRFSKFLTARFSRKFAIKLLLKIPSHLVRVAALPCETSMSENKRHSQINARSVAAHI